MLPDVKCRHADSIGSSDVMAWMEPPRTFILSHHPVVQGAGLGFWGMLPALMPLGGEERFWSLLSVRVSLSRRGTPPLVSLTYHWLTTKRH